MGRSEVLFQLVKSLTSAEKRNFKLFTQFNSGKETNYEKLFDAIDKQDVYDEGALIDQFSKEKFVKQFSVAKNYLYNSILRSLSYFHRDANSELSALAIQVKILIEKALYPQALKLLRKCKNNARKQEGFAEMLTLFQMEREIMRRMQDAKRIDAVIRDIQMEEKLILEKLNNLAEYQFLTDDCFRIIRKYLRNTSPEGRDAIEPFVNHELMVGQEAALSVRAKVKYWRMRLQLDRYLGDFEGEIEAATSMIQILEDNPSILAELYYEYIVALGELINVYIRTRDEVNIEQTLAKLRAIEIRSPRGRLTMLERYHAYNLVYSMHLNDMLRGKRAIMEMENDLSEFQNPTTGDYEDVVQRSMLLNLFYSSSYIEFISEDFSESLKWINKFLNEPRNEIRVDLQASARLLNLLIHLELGNHDVVEIKLKSVTRFLHKAGHLHRFQKAMLKSIRKQLKLSDKDLFAEYRRLLAELYTLQDDPVEVHAMAGLDAIAWLRSKLEEKRYADLLGEADSGLIYRREEEKVEVKITEEEAKLIARKKSDR